MTRLQFPLYLVLFVCFACRQDTGKKEKPQSTATNSTYADCTMLLADARRHDSILLTHLDADSAAGVAAINAFTLFARHCSGDSASALYLIKTGQVAHALNMPLQAKNALERCIEDHKDFSGRPAALFLLAQLHDERNFLNNPDEARRIYRQIEDEYPQSVWATNAHAAAKLVGRTDEDIMKDLKSKIR